MAKITTNPISYEEQQLMAIHNLNNDAGTRQGMIDVLEEIRKASDPDIPEDADLLVYTDAALTHLREMSDEDFEALDLIVDFPE